MSHVILICVQDVFYFDQYITLINTLLDYFDPFIKILDFKCT